jgi:hypothetical protein
MVGDRDGTPALVHAILEGGHEGTVPEPPDELPACCTADGAECRGATDSGDGRASHVTSLPV